MEAETVHQAARLSMSYLESAERACGSPGFEDRMKLANASIRLMQTMTRESAASIVPDAPTDSSSSQEDAVCPA